MPRSAANSVLVFSPWIFFIRARSSSTVSALYAITAYIVRRISVHVKFAGRSDKPASGFRHVAWPRKPKLNGHKGQEGKRESLGSRPRSGAPVGGKPSPALL